MPFRLSVSNYTVKIESENYNFHFLKKEQSQRTFVAGKMIERDLKRFKVPKINMAKNEYFALGLTNEFYADKIFNIDIKNAYATILFNDGYLEKKTYLFLCNLKKEERLAALGMIASRKQIFEHDRNGKIIENLEIINPLSNFFFSCVQKTADIILDVKNKIMTSGFLFSWVDGIYFNDESGGSIAAEYIKEEYNLNTTLKTLTNFEVKKRNDFFKIFFLEGENKKTFAIPIPESNLKKKIIAHLLNKDYGRKKNISNSLQKMQKNTG